MILHQYKIIKLNFILILRILVIIIITCTYNNSLAVNFFENIFGSTDTSFGINKDKTDKSYNNVTISNSIINNISKNIYCKNNNIISNNLSYLTEEKGHSDISLGLCQYHTTSKNNKATIAYSQIIHNIGNINAVTNYTRFIHFGGGYGFANTKFDIYDRTDKRHLGSDNITTHIAILYTYIDFFMSNTNINLMGAISKHNPESADVSKKYSYNSQFFSVNLNSETNASLLLFNLHFLFKLGYAKVFSDKTTIDNISIPKGRNGLFYLGLSLTTYNKLDIKLMSLAYRLSVGYQFDNTSGHIINQNNFYPQASEEKALKQFSYTISKKQLKEVEITHKPPIMHNLIAEINLSLSVHKHLQLALDLIYIYGNKTDEYGASASVSYIF